MFEVSVRHSLGAFTIEADIHAHGRILAISGPSGAGKTTLLDMIAGLTRPAQGRIAVDEVVFLDTATGTDLPTRRRRIGYVFQEPRLFPHLSVAGNLKFGARFAPAGAPLVAFDEVVALLGVGTLLSRRPSHLSGGEKQRVAIGRALLGSPRVLLLDEPLTAIDDARRDDILALIEQLRDTFAIPMIFVSHQTGEVERLASDVAVLRSGRLVEMRAGGARLK